MGLPHGPIRPRVRSRGSFRSAQTPKSPMPRRASGFIAQLSSAQTPKSPIPRRASGFNFPIPAKSGFPGDFPNPGFRPNRDSRFPESRDPDQIGIQIRENPDFFAAARAVIKKTCQRQARLVRFLIGVPLTVGGKRGSLYISLRAAIASLLWRSMTNFEKVVGDIAICLSDMTSFATEWQPSEAALDACLPRKEMATCKG